MNKIEEKNEYCIKIVQSALNDSKSIQQILKELNINNKDFVRDHYRRGVSLIKKGALSQDKFRKFSELYNEYKSKIRNANSKGNSDVNKLYLIRSKDDSRIIFYKFILKNEEKLLSRDEIERIYKLYSDYGAGISKKNIVPYFTTLTLEEVNNIIKILGITKQSIPVPPHIMEEKEVDEIVDNVYSDKESLIREKYYKDQCKVLERGFINLVKENEDLRNLKEGMQDIVKEYLVKEKIVKDNIPVTELSYSKARALVIHLADMHIGADVPLESIYDNTYNVDIVISRMNKIIDMIRREVAIYGKFSCIIINNLGDSLDGMNGQTCRGGHQLPQNLTNKEQMRYFIEAITYLVSSINSLDLADSIMYKAVGSSNHDGDFGYAANFALCTILNSKFENVHAKVFDKFIGSYNIGVHTYILCHGKDEGDMKRNMPLVLDSKTENFINEYINTKRYDDSIPDEYIGKGNRIHFVKGDLHNSATTYGKQFRYKSVGSFFGSSKWVHSNFGNTKACVDYDIISLTNDYMLEGRIILN